MKNLLSLKPFQNFAASSYVCSANSVYIHILPSYWTTLCYWAYQSSVICSPYVAIDQIFRRMNLSALVLHLTWAVPDIFASCVSNGIHSVSIKYTSLFNREYFLHPPVSRASEYGISLFEIYEAAPSGSGQRVAYHIGKLSNAEISDFSASRRVYRVEPPISSTFDKLGEGSAGEGTLARW